MEQAKRMHELSISCKLDKPTAIIVFCLNVFLPGWGTVFAGIIHSHEMTRNNLVIGTIQYFTAFILVGWVWSIYVGFKIYKVSSAEEPIIQKN
jgi:tetrahydromethanopterin S-methyltransferase subunit E